MKAQIKMGESIAIIIVFFFIVVFGLIFYSRVERDSIVQEGKELTELRAISITQVISFLPEAQCRFFNIVEKDCFDIIKMESFEAIAMSSTDMQLYYYDVFGYANITVEQIYPPSDRTWTLYKRAKNATTITRTPIPIALYNATANTYGIGRLIVEVYS